MNERSWGKEYFRTSRSSLLRFGEGFFMVYYFTVGTHDKHVNLRTRELLNRFSLPNGLPIS